VSDEALMWVVYDHPKDMPDHYVARAWLWGAGHPNGTPTTKCVASHSIEELRLFIARMGFVRIERHTIDDPVIMETWI